MSAMNLFIEPSDVWLFRDARPFAAGEQSRATSLFPPTPRTVQGALRSARLGQSGEPFDFRRWSQALQNEIGQPDNFGALNLRGPVLAKRKNANQVQPFFSLPQDVAEYQNGWQILTPQTPPTWKLNWQGNLQPLLPPAGSEPKKFESGWLCEDALLAYLKGNVCGLHVHTSDKLFERESRFGVQIDSYPKRPTEGNLYQIEFMRLRTDVGLLVEVNGINLNRSGLLQLGGESRAARYHTITTNLDLSTAGRLSIGNQPLHFKLYLATPAIFKQGWLPDNIKLQANGDYTGSWRGVDVKLIAAALSRAQPIGGRDISQKDKQRILQRAVPAGSVYFFEVTDAGKQEADVMNAFDGKCVSDADAQIGFGLCYIGGW